MCRAFPVPNSWDGVDALLERVERLNDDHQPVRYGLEATGHYWLPLYDALGERQQQVVVLNPLRTSAYRRLSIRPVKNDQRDAYWIAQALRQEPAREAGDADEHQRALRSLSRLRVELTAQLGDQKRRALAVLDQVFPEFAALFSDPFGKAALAVLQRCATPAAVMALGVEDLAALLKQTSRGALGRVKAQALFDAAQRSFGCRLDLEALTFQLQLFVRHIHFLLEQRHDLDEQIARQLARVDQHLTSIPGIDTVLAAALVGELGNVRRFRNARCLVAFAGIDPRVIQSGQFEAQQTRMSKRGSPYLRLALWQAATVASWGTSPSADLYRRKRAAGKHHGVAIGAVMNKLIRIIYAVLRDNRGHLATYPQAT